MVGMNKRVELLGAVRSALAGMGADLDWSGSPAGEATVTLDGVDVQLPLEIRPQLRPSTVGLVPDPGPDGLLVATQLVTPQVGALLRARGISYVDAAGNASVRAPGLVLEVAGRKPARGARTPAGPGMLARASLPVVLAILNAPGLLDAPLRQVQAHTTVSLGSTQKAIRALREAGFAQPLTPESTRDERDRWRGLLEAWVLAYGEETGRHSLGRFRSDRSLAEIVDVWDDEVALSGEMASAVIGSGLRPGSLVGYVNDPGELGRLVTAGRLRPDPRGDIEVRTAIWSPVAEDDNPRQGSARVAPSPVVYADLLAVADPRTNEAARRWLADDPSLRALVDA